ncbi:type IV toxin-antitoxin system AbiEi family antitoxin [Mucilaginibacter aquaedulcis]|uniref:type IV toxin-antitoxin system AbiEi family antitoxin n=1 Tax=Mucilaginibacter aquaedulcis TaxID=1187081 RepID=UPI0025B568C6|nr:type IV toxin-antitoxin system AbiEi family antitoxin [Mucilaginibacter aquaedulcis]MDN3548826.1 type IV toxin-antitoxin system AbiEi family antitoxin [Mucilaginibacter aquaedulcis]
MNTKEQEILDQATEKLALLTGVTIKTLKSGTATLDDRCDAEIEIRSAKNKVHFVVEIKNELRNKKYLPAKRQKGIANLLVAQYIPKPLKQELKSINYNYLDAAGNCFIQTPELFIYINDQQVTGTRVPVEGKLWKTAGLKFLFAILIQPELLNHSYRQIAEEADIALGNVGGLLEELKKEGYVLDGGKNKGLFIGYKERLINRWAEAYMATLRPKLLAGNFRFIVKDQVNHWDQLETNQFKWGGENAGALLTDFLRPEKFTIYTREPKAVLMKKLHLIPDLNGNIEILEQFWKDNGPGIHIPTVPALLAYAELITSFDSRNQETAERIKMKYLD